MTETAGPVTDTAAASATASAGAMLRRAREARGMHIAALAASLKVPPKRLEALENDRWDELPDLAFARALAQSVCRALKTDPSPVLALLPRADGRRLEQVGGSINAPFNERPGGTDQGVGGLLSRPVLWIVALLLIAAAAVLLWPRAIAPVTTADGPPGTLVTEEPLAQVAPRESAEPVAPAGVGAADSPGGPPPTADAGAATPAAAEGDAATPVAPPAEASASAAAAGPTLVVRANAASWVEVRDAGGQVLVSRTLDAGETVALDAALPAQLTTGNAGSTEVLLRGQRIELQPQRGSIARVELK